METASASVIRAMLWVCACLCGAMMCIGALAAEPSQVEAYDETTDPFYKRTPVYATWVMIWNGPTEKWWKPSDYHGCKVEVDGAWQSIDWSNPRHIDAYCRSIRDAGINVIIVDFTNGFRWKWQAKQIQQFCSQNGMKFAIAFNPQGGSKADSGCKAIWDGYASPDNPLAASYLHYDGKPLAVFYTTRNGFQASRGADGPHRERFSAVWSSGEDSEKNKWGWQLEPHVGPVASDDAMFVTASIKYSPPRASDDEWRRHLSWLDYGFILARKSKAKFVIVGSFDDMHERNAWMIVDSEQAPAGWQTRDATGALNHDAFYKRVSEWLKGKPSVVKGGLIPDGAYLFRSARGTALGSTEPRRPPADASLIAPADSVDSLIWFYHLGGDVYRITKLNAGLSLEVKDGLVCFNLDRDSAAQRWAVKRDGKGFRLLNEETQTALSIADGKVRTDPPDDAAAQQVWTLDPRATVTPANDPASKPAE